ncbi:uncharacterized protein LOC135558375 isoform X3 [Oncorhynchus masou masou]|uniref:uncharacterized protein LOC135558375 isoform X3 n=1 Tax=Oncorhynchus masou masou TaxID=90313 RepID=UPI00318332A6
MPEMPNAIQLQMQKRHRMDALRDGLPLPLSSLRLLIPPLRLVSAALWQVVQQRDVMDYGLVEEFVTTVLEIVPDMMSYRERVQLIMGLRAQLVLELCRSDHLANPETIQPHLNRMKTCMITHRDKEISDPEVEASESNFLKLIQTLLEDPVEKEHFFQSVFPEEFGPKYNSALQTLVWEFLSRLEKLLPAPTLQQTASWFLPDPSVLEECVQCVSHPQPLKTLLQHHSNTGGHVDTNGLFSGENQIPIEADPEVQSEPVQQCMSHVSSDNKSDMTSLLELGIDSDRTVHKGVEPVHKGVEPVHKGVEPVHKGVEPLHKVVESASLEVTSCLLKQRRRERERCLYSPAGGVTHQARSCCMEVNEKGGIKVMRERTRKVRQSLMRHQREECQHVSCGQLSGQTFLPDCLARPFSQTVWLGPPSRWIVVDFVCVSTSKALDPGET